MKPLAEHFNYRVAVWNRKMCSIFAEDIYDRFEQIHRESPEVFARLSYGRVTTGAYVVPGSQIVGGHTSEGHVGVVVYPKGTDYLRTGIVVHGTPTWSYLDVDSETLVGPLGISAPSFQGAMGIAAAGTYGTGLLLNFGTAQHGLYYRTPARNMAGNLVMEGGRGCGFEGVYPDNNDVFREPLTCATESTLTPRTEKVASCPIYPDAVTVQTESPVEIHLKNARGQRVETQDGRIVAQELDSEIFSWALPHDDGTYAWTLVLPKDEYDIQLVGTGTGPYKLTFTTFDAEGRAVADVYEGVATPGQTSDYTLFGAVDNTASNVIVEATEKKGGGGSFDVLLLSLLGSLAGWRLLQLRRSQVRRGH